MACGSFAYVWLCAFHAQDFRIDAQYVCLYSMNARKKCRLNDLEMYSHPTNVSEHHFPNHNVFVETFAMISAIWMAVDTACNRWHAHNIAICVWIVSICPYQFWSRSIRFWDRQNIHRHRNQMVLVVNDSPCTIAGNVLECEGDSDSRTLAQLIWALVILSMIYRVLWGIFVSAV